MDEMSKVEGQRLENDAPRITVLLMLLDVFSVEQLTQLAMTARMARRMEQTDLSIRFKGGKPRWMKLDEWVEMEKPAQAGSWRNAKGVLENKA